MGRYIGARYVPIIGGAWDSTQEYEPLTMVQYEGNTYTSKIYVPAGIAITNTAYWVKTADFNQQLANVNQQIVYINERMQDAEQEIDSTQGDLNVGVKRRTNNGRKSKNFTN